MDGKRSPRGFFRHLKNQSCAKCELDYRPLINAYARQAPALPAAATPLATGELAAAELVVDDRGIRAGVGVVTGGN